MKTKIAINGVEYDVQIGDTERSYMSGQIYLTSKRIRMRPVVYGKKRTREEMEHTLWHELVHGILHEVGRKRLALDEKLVDDVASAIIEIQKQLEAHGKAQLFGD